MCSLLKTELVPAGIDCSLCAEVKGLQKNTLEENGIGQSQLFLVLASQHLCETLCPAFSSHVGIRKTGRILPRV